MSGGTSTDVGYSFSGGFTLIGTDTPTIGDIIGDKQVIGFAFNGKDSQNNTFPLTGQFWDSTNGNILLLSDEDIKATQGGNVSGFARPSVTMTQPITVDVYAICI